MKEAIKAFAQTHDFLVLEDAIGNILCQKGSPQVCLQAHYDMVCIGDTQNIGIVIEKGIIRAKNSTLGADNGMGMAMMFWAMEHNDNLECLFTVDEEVGLIGAMQFSLPLKSVCLLNLDAEEEGKPRGLAADATDEETAKAKKEVKESQKEFTSKLASYADVYVNDAFGTAHRAHASTALIADYFDEGHKLFGYLLQNEITAVEKVMKDTQRPFTAIMGGSKVSSKIEIIKNLLDKVDNLILAGGMTYTFAKAFGGKIGDSIVEDDKLDLAKEIVEMAKAKGVNLVLATDAKIADSFSNDAKTGFASVQEIPDGWEGLDIGPDSEKLFTEVIKNSKTILWNGPVGVFEFDNFDKGSRAVSDAIVEATKKGAFSLVGGGDSVACVNKFGHADEVSYVSTGGGALLEMIEGKILPGVKAIRGN